MNDVNSILGQTIIILHSHGSRPVAISEILSEEGYIVRQIVPSDLSLLDLTTIHPVLFLLETNIPEKEFVQILEVIKSSEDTRDVPVILIGELEEKQKIIESLYSDHFDFIAPSCTKSDILARVKTHIRYFLLQLDLKTKNKNLEEEIAKRKPAEQIISLSENQFRTTLYSIGDGVITTDGDGKVKIMNPVAEQMTGWNQRDAEGKLLEEVFQIINEETRNPVEIPVRKVLRQGTVVGIANHTLLIARDGTERPIADSAAPIRDDDGKISGVILVFRDQSEERKKAKELWQSEQKYRYLFENNPQPMWIYDLQTLAFLNVNEAAINHYGYTKSEFLSMTLKDIRPEEDVINLLEDVSHTVKPYNKAGIWTHRKKNGELINVEIISHTLDYDNRPARMVLTNDVTQRIQAEKELRESEERFRTTLYSIGDGVITTDTKGKVQLMNQVAENLTGWSQAEAQGNLLEDVFPIINEDTRAQVEIPVRRVLREGVVVGLANHTLLLSKDGTERPIADSGAPIRNEKDEIIGVVLVFRDQTEERKIENALRESEFFFRESQRAASIGSYNLSVPTGFWTSSEVLDQIFGIDNDYTKNIDGWESLIYPDDLQRMDHHFKVEVIGQQMPFNNEYRIVRKSDGAVRWVHGLGKLIMDNRGNIISMTGTIQDITARKIAEKALFESEEKFRNLFEHSPVGKSITEVDGSMNVNQAFCDMLGFTKEELNRKNFSQITHPEDIKQTEESLLRLIQGLEKSTRIEKRYIHKSGSIVWADVSTFLMRDSDGKPQYFITSVNNITDRKKAEEQLKKSEKEYRSLARNLDAGIVIHRPDNSIKFANDQASKLLGLSVDQAQGIGATNLPLLYYYEDETPMRKEDFPVNKVLATQQPVRDIVAGIYQPGISDPTWILVNAFPEFDQEGNIIQVVESFVDITHQRNVEAIMRESESRYESFVNANTDMIFVKDNHFRYLMANESMARFYNKNREELLGKTDQELAEYSHISPCQSSDKKALEAKAAFTIEEKLGDRIFEVTKFPLQLKNKKPGIGGIMRDITERKQVVETLQNERNLLRILIDNLPDAIYIKDCDGRKIISNRFDMENIGYFTTQNIIGKTDLELFDRETGERGYADDMKVIQTGQPILNKEETFPDKKVGIRYLLTSKIPLHDSKGNLTGLVGVGRDITDQKKALETIQKLSESIEQSPSSITITDIIGNIEYVNPKFTEITGYSSKEVIGKKPRILNQGKIPTEKFNEFWNTISSGQVWRGEFNNRKKNGTIFTESVVISPVLDEQKTLTNLLIISEDITQKKKEEKIRNVIYAITQDGSAAKDLGIFIDKVKKRLGELTDVSNFYLALYSEADDSFWIPLYNDQHDSIKTFKAAKTLTAYVLRSKKPFLGTSDDINKLKNAGLVESIGEPAKIWLGVPLLAGDKCMGVFVVQSYDNPRAFSEQDQQMLELVGHEISHILQRMKSEEEIKLALEKAEESDRLKSAFLANMSHEIRTPLNSIMGFSELLEDDSFTSKQKKEFVRNIRVNGNNLLNIINDIIDISKIESGEISIRKSAIQVAKLMSETEALHKIGIEEKGLRMRISIPENLAGTFAYADRERLNQIFNNLIGNALKFTSQGFIQVGCIQVDNFLEFHVKDTGIGIPEQYHQTIFDRFRQVETSHTRKFGGNGLGLSITKNLVELMGGRIWLESEPGMGSTFFFTVPLAPKQQNFNN